MGTKNQKGGRNEQRESERLQETKTRQQAEGKGDTRSGEKLMGVQTEVESQERGVGIEAVTRTGVKPELRMHGRDKQAKNVGAQQGQHPDPPHCLQQ